MNRPATTRRRPSTGWSTGRTRGGAPMLVIALVLTVLSFQLNATMVAPSLPDMARELGVGLDAVAQVTSLFFLTGAIGGVVLSRWSDYLGRRTVLLLVLLLLVVGTLVCIVAPTLPWMLVGRALQGFASAAFPLAYLVLRQRLSLRAFGVSLGIITAFNSGIIGLDGYFGGLLTVAFGFRAIFVAILIVTLIALVGVLVGVPADDLARSAGGMDWWGAAALSVGLIGATQLVSAVSSAAGSASASIVWLLVTAGGLVAFWAIEKRRASPLIAIEHLRSRRVWPVLLTTGLALAGLFPVLNFTVMLLSQDTAVGFGLSPAFAALFFLTPAALVALFAAPVSGWLAARIGWTLVLRFGLGASGLLLAALAIFPTNVAVVFTGAILLGMTYSGIVLTTVNGLGVMLSPPDAPAALPGMNGAAFGLGISVGIAAVAPFAGSATTDGYATAFWIAGALAAAALGSSLFIERVKVSGA